MINEIIWSAGFFDGEGYIGINEKKKETNGGNYRWLNLVVSVGQVDKTPLDIFHKLYGGHWGKQIVNEKTYHHWVIEAQLAAKFLEQVVPYLVNKKTQAEVALTFQRQKIRRGKPLDDFEKAELESFNEAFKEYRWRIHEQ